MSPKPLGLGIVEAKCLQGAHPSDQRVDALKVFKLLKDVSMLFIFWCRAVPSTRVARAYSSSVKLKLYF